MKTRTKVGNKKARNKVRRINNVDILSLFLNIKSVLTRPLITSKVIFLGIRKFI